MSINLQKDTILSVVLCSKTRENSGMTFHSCFYYTFFQFRKFAFNWFLYFLIKTPWCLDLKGKLKRLNFFDAFALPAQELSLITSVQSFHKFIHFQCQSKTGKCQTDRGNISYVREIKTFFSNLNTLYTNMNVQIFASQCHLDLWRSSHKNSKIEI